MGPEWLEKAVSYIGAAEIKGKHHNIAIIRWWEKIKAPFRDDETPWCAAFVGGVLEESGIWSTRNAAARSYMKWGIPLNEPRLGCIVVFWRGKRTGWSGHVGFVVGRDSRGKLMVLGGNQGDKVSIRAFPAERILGFRWPDPKENKFFNLPTLTEAGLPTQGEA